MADDQDRNAKLDRVHDFLFRIPDGAGKGEEPLAVHIGDVVRAYRRLSWLTRIMIWGIPTVALVGTAAITIAKWISGGLAP